MMERMLRKDEQVKSKVVFIPIAIIVICSSMSGCFVDYFEPHYVFNLHIWVTNGEIKNVSILLPLPTKDKKVFYGIEELTGIHNISKNEPEKIYIEIIETDYGIMLRISCNKMNKTNFYISSCFHQDDKINAKNPLGNEYLLTPKLNISEKSEKLNAEKLLATYQSPIYFCYNASENVNVITHISFEGYNHDGSGKYAYYDRLDDLEFEGPKNEWMIVNGNIIRRNLNE